MASCLPVCIYMPASDSELVRNLSQLTSEQQRQELRQWIGPSRASLAPRRR
jgi:hypothetical protein